MTDQLFGLMIAVLALAFFASASQLESPFFSDPLGPKAFPYMISVTAFLAAGTMIAKPDVSPKWPKFETFKRLFMSLIILVLYAYSLKPLGFIIPTALASGTLSFQISSRFSSAIIIGITLSVGLFLLFKFGLRLSLFAWPWS
jgi:putative tricarboxylic transport membrane protein